jgi:hypothetical protein
VSIREGLVRRRIKKERTMRFISIYRTDAHKAPSPRMMAEMGAFMAEAVAAGILLATDGIGASTKHDFKVRLAKGDFTATDGPFTEAKEVIGGFAIMQTKTRDEMMHWTRRFLEIAGDGECEIHQLSDLSPLEQMSKQAT